MVGVAEHYPPGYQPFTLTARLRHGVSIDLNYSIALDGLLSGLVRQQHQPSKTPTTEQLDGPAIPGRPSELDGGLHTIEPTIWNLPLAVCPITADTTRWHWLCTAGQLLDHQGDPIPVTTLKPTIYRVNQTARHDRLERASVKLPTTLPQYRKRFRDRLTPIVSYPGGMMRWRGVGDPTRVLELVAEVPSIGSRRGGGEGAVSEWHVASLEASPIIDWDRFGHSHSDGSQGRPLPLECCYNYGFPHHRIGLCGIRPPLFHAYTQQELVFPAPE